MSRGVKFVFWFSIVYITIALSFWGNSLYESAAKDIELELQILDYKYPDKNNTEYLKAKKELDTKLRKKKSQYWGEGLTFYFFIILSAAIVYYLLRKENKRTEFQKNLLFYVTHELKTPIASVKLALQTLGKRKVSDDQKNQILNMGLEEVRRLNDLTNNILFLSKIESNQIKVDKKELSVLELLRPIIREYENAQDTHEINLEGKDILIEGDEFLLSLIFSNLISNAIKYSPKANRVEIIISEHTEINKIEVVDYGAGISEKDRKNIFKKFYRAQNPESDYLSGTGLGLYLVNRLSKLFKIELDYKYENQKSTFELSIKKIES